MATNPLTRDVPVIDQAALDREVKVELATRLAGESQASELVHVVLAAITAALIWPAVDDRLALWWFASIALAAGLRGKLRERSRGPSIDPDAVQRTIRVGVGLLALTWGWGVIVVGRVLPIELLALLTVIIAGIIAGGTIALLADPPSFYTMQVGMLFPLSMAMVMSGVLRAHLIGAGLIVLFGAIMSVYYRRSHGALLKQIRLGQQLRITTAAAEKARDAAEQMVRIVEATTDLVTIATPDGRVVYMNRAGRAMTGFGASEDIGDVTFRELTPKHMHETVQDQIRTILRDGTWSGESLLQHRDGHEIPISAVAIAHRNGSQKVDSISAVARDVTEQVVTRKALQTARDAAEQMAAAKSSFLANTSHEIRTPLNGILGMVELLLDTELTPSQRRSAELIASSGETLLNTINDVLDLSKIEAGQMEMEKIPFDLHNVVHSTVRLLISRASAKSVELVSDVDGDVPQHVMGDPHRLRQVLVNLIGNAVKFTSAGEVVVSVRRLSGANGRVRARIGVKDTGIGIPAAHVERIFDPFRQVDTSTTRQYGGTGLGLSIARKIVGMMGGTLAVDSEPSKGSDFHFTVEWDVAPETEGTAEREPGSLRGVRTLVVDDHPVNRRVLADMLRWGGSEVLEAESVGEALEALRRSHKADARIALVVSDVQMPERDGFDLAAEMRSDAQLRQAGIMLLTSAGRPGDGQKCRELGVSAYMQKPVSRVELVEAAVAALAIGGPKAHRRTLVTRQKLDETRLKLRVLVAEDNPVNQEVAASLLRKRGHDVEIVGNGREAVEAVRRGGEPFDVVLMDIQMPEQDGISATREIRAGDMTLPIVALTASVSSGERERCLAAGMSGYLAKPFKPHDLYAQVEGWSSDQSSNGAEKGGPAPVDLEGFTAMLSEAGIPEAGDKMIAAFLEDTPSRVVAMQQAADAEDLNALATHAHRVASGAASIYARELARMLRDAETAARDGDLKSARSAARGAGDEFERVEAYLREAQQLTKV
jgi:two-component system sensor histidine kinase/response regulator